MYSAYKLNKQDEYIQPWHTHFPIWNQPIVPCPVLTVAFCLAHKFLKRQVRWSVIPISKNFLQFVVIHTVKSFRIVNEEEIDVFLERSCFFDYPADVGNLISGSSAFSKPSLNIRKFTVHELLKPGLENFWACVWAECNCVVVWAFFGIAFLWDWNENWPFLVLWPLLSFQICWHTECSTFTASAFRIWNSSSGVPSPSLALWVVMLSKGFLCGSDSKASAYTAGDLGSTPGSGISSGEGNGNPLQYSCLENPMDGGAR